MNAKEFVGEWKKEKDQLVSNYCNDSSQTKVRAILKNMDLKQEQIESMNELINQILTDSFYGLLLGLDGSAAIGDTQQSYKILDEKNELIAHVGELEAEAFEQFQPKWLCV